MDSDDGLTNMLEMMTPIKEPKNINESKSSIKDRISNLKLTLTQQQESRK